MRPVIFEAKRGCIAATSIFRLSSLVKCWPVTNELRKSAGGTNAPSNAAHACRTCNRDMSNTLERSPRQE